MTGPWQDNARPLSSELWHHLPAEFLNFLLIFTAGCLVLRRPERERLAFGLLVIRFGPRPRYIGLAVLLAGFGLYMGLRHSSLHLWRDVGQGFSAEIMGAHTYTWSMFIYWVCVVMMGVLLLLLKDGEAARETPCRRSPAPARRRPIPV